MGEVAGTRKNSGGVGLCLVSMVAVELESCCDAVGLVSGLGDGCRLTQCIEAAASQHDVAEYQVVPDVGRETGEGFDLVVHNTKAGGGPHLHSRATCCEWYDAGVPLLS